MQAKSSYEISFGGETGKAVEFESVLRNRLESFPRLEQLVQVTTTKSTIVLKLGELLDIDEAEREIIVTQLLDIITDRTIRNILDKDPKISLTERTSQVSGNVTPLVKTYTHLLYEKDVLSYMSTAKKMKDSFFTNQAIFALEIGDTTITVTCKPRILAHRFTVQLMIADFQYMLVSLIESKANNHKVACLL